MPPKRRVQPEPEETVEETPAPRRRGRPRKTETVEQPAAKTTTTHRRRSTPAEKEEPAPAASNGYGTAWLVEHVNEELGTDLDGKALRVILRELTEDGVISRDDRSRYSFKGPRDRAVLAVIKRVKSGAQSDDDKPARGRPAATKTAATKTTATKSTTARRGRPAKKTEPEPDPDLPDFDDEEEELDDEIEDL